MSVIITKYFKSLVCFDVFTEELAHLHSHIKLFNKESTTPLKKVTKISTVCEVLSKKPKSKKCFLKIHKLLQIYRGVALVSAFAERCFSVMRRIKTWLFFSIFILLTRRKATEVLYIG